MSILVAHPDRVRLRALSRALDGAGYAVAQAQTGAEVLALAEKAPPDLAFIDASLPDIAGADVCHRLRASGHTHAYLILLFDASRVSTAHVRTAAGDAIDALVADSLQNREMLARTETGLQVKAVRDAHARELRALNDAVIAISQLDDVDAICRYVADTVRALNPDAIITVTMYDPALDAIRLRAVAGMPELIERLVSLAGLDPWKVHVQPDAVGQRYAAGKMTRLEGGLHTLTAGAFSPPVARLLERAVNVTDVYACGFALGQTSSGAIAILTKAGQLPHGAHTIEALASHVSVVLHEQMAETALRLSETHLRHMIDASETLIFSLGRDGVFRMAAGDRLLTMGLTYRDIVGRKLQDVLGPEDVANVTRRIDEVLARGQLISYEQVFRRPGRDYVESITMYPLGDQPDVVGIMSRDVTDQRLLEQQLRQQERLAVVGQLAAGIAHDFNNIMAVIVLYAQMAARAPDLPPRLHHQLAVIIEQAHHSTSLINQILDFSRQSSLEQRPLALGPYLQGLCQMLSRTLPENIRVELDLACDEARVMADPTRLQQALINLATNARDAMPQGGRIRFALSGVRFDSGDPLPDPGLTPGPWLKLDVADTGCGMTPEVLGHAFEPFFTTKAPGTGTGLGLSQVHGIVGQHAGAVTLTSAPGAGTTVTLYLPLLVDKVPAGTEEAPCDPVQGSGERVLIVEDDPATRQALVLALETLGYQPATASTGREALEVLTSRPGDIDCVLSDAIMPEMGGLALLNEMDAQHLPQPVILLSGHLTAEPGAPPTATPRFLARLGKPVELHTLAETLADALSSDGRGEGEGKG